MSEEELNKKWLKDELIEFSCSNEFFDKILDLLSKQYINGLEQSRFEKNLLEQENRKLKQQISNSHQMKNQQKEFMEYLEEPIKIITEGNPTNISEYTSAKLDTLKEVLQKYKEIIGGNNDQ